MAALLTQLYGVKWLLLSAALFLYIIRKYQTYRRLQAFDGPFLAKWSTLWHSFATLSFRSHIWYRDVCDNYGTIVRVGPNDLMTTSPEILVHMSAVRSAYKRSAWFYGASRVEPGNDHVFSQLDEEKHMKRRHQMAAGYSGKENHALESTIDTHIREFLDLVRNNYLSTISQSKPMDMARKVQYFTLDVISHIGFGQSFGDIKADADLNDYVLASEQGLAFMAFAIGVGLSPILRWEPIARLLGPSEKDKKGFGKLMNTARRLIDTRLTQSTEKRSDMLASFIRHGLTREQLFTEAILQILAGSDTTATAIRSTMLYIISHPRVYVKLQAEVDAAVASGVAPPAPEIIPETTTRTLKYLQAVMYEGMRIHPPVTDEVPKVVPEGGDTVIVDGKPIYFPGGTNIGYSVLGINRRKDIFGDDVDQFRPERWLVGDSEDEQAKLTAMKKTTELIFGYGKYQCLGKSIAWMEISKVLFEFVRHFDWAIASPEKAWREVNYLGVFVHERMWVLATERTPKE